MGLDITEDWIKSRVKVENDCLDDVKSLALPGTYHEKISNLGYSLQNFTRIQHLDLSKNNIASLKGLEHLTLLETLNLYYNKIGDLKEVFRLRSNQNLRDVDLRLNPVTGNEPDYRLFIAHMLPLLRRLDDRPLRDSERKAAVMHFSSETPNLFTKSDQQQQQQEEATGDGNRKSKQPRVNFVKSVTQKPSVVAEDDDVNDVIDYVSKKREAKSDESDEPQRSQQHTKQELLKIVRKENEDVRRQLNRQRDFDQKPLTSYPTESHFDRDHHLKFTDEDSAYSQYKSVANYTPHPGTDEPPPTQASETPPASMEDFKKLPESKCLNFGESTSIQQTSRCRNLIQTKFLESLLDLVDRYWNGSRSLHHHHKFQGLAQKPMEMYEREMTSSRDVQLKVLEDKISTQQREIQQLHHQLHQATKPQQHHPHVDPKELESAKSRAQAANSDNKILRSKISDLEKDLRTFQKKSENAGRVEELERERNQLSQQVSSLKINVEQMEQSARLTHMLHDSHKSLTASNEHLLRELEETRSRHQSEIEQLKWSYDQLRSTSKLTNGHALHNGEL